jgi:hypothetical protein
MRPVETLNRASERDARPALAEQVRSETLANKRDIDHLSERTGGCPGRRGTSLTAVRV